MSGLEIIKFKNDDKIIVYISLMGKNHDSFCFCNWRKIYIIHIHNSYTYKFIEIDKIEEGTLLNRTNDSLDPFDYHHEKCGLDSFKTLQHTRIHTSWPRDDEEAVGDEDNVLFDEDLEDVNVYKLEFTGGVMRL